MIYSVAGTHVDPLFGRIRLETYPQLPDEKNRLHAVSIERSRLLALIEYVQQSARSRAKVVSNVADHGRFLLFDHQVAGVEGVVLDSTGEDGEEPLWLSVPRPPNPELPPKGSSPWLSPWLGVGDAVLAAPQLASAVEGAALIAAGTHRDSTLVVTDLRQAADPAVAPGEVVRLAEYGFRPEVERQLARYLEHEWAPWAEFERRRRRRARLYVQLLTLQQELAGALVDGQLELVWGVGLGVWKHDDTTAAYPLVTCPVDLAFNVKTGAAEIRPRDAEPRLELDFYTAIDRPGVAQADRLSREFISASGTPISPFEPESFEPLLDIARACLDPEAEVPGTGEPKLRITRSWVLFARPRSASVLIQDLDRFARALQQAGEEPDLPPAVAALVSEPSTAIAPVALPRFRGVSTIAGDAAAEAGDLHFPKPFNDEQLRIVQLLESNDGVVVQGPPGTGKTHTIANIICHWLASGRRVLVTSMKDPALAVLRDKLPEEIRPLAIALLANEEDGMKQFEASIHKIASEVQSIDPVATGRDIARLTDSIDALHDRLGRIDADLNRWARINLMRIDLEGENVDPLDAAHEVAQSSAGLDWLPDALGAGPQYAPNFSDDDFARLRSARLRLGPDIDYAGRRLPEPGAFPDARTMLQTHDDLVRFARLAGASRAGDVPMIADPGQETLVRLHETSERIERIVQLRERIAAANRPWTAALATRLKAGVFNNECRLLDTLGQELEQANGERGVFLERPVTAPKGSERDRELIQAAENLAAGRRAFGLTGVFFRNEAKAKLDAVEVAGQSPVAPADWQHVAAWLRLQLKARELVARWNGLAAELGLDAVPIEDPRSLALVLEEFTLYREVHALATEESALVQHAARLFPGWPLARRVAQDDAALADLERIIGHYLGTYRLGEVWLVKERLQSALDGTGGRVVDEVRRFLATILGDPEVAEQGFLAGWSALVADMGRLGTLADALATVAEVTEQIERCGAPKFAAALRQPDAAGGLSSMPEDWRAGWRRRRLATHLSTIDSQQEFRRLAAARQDLEHDLARLYHDAVVRRTWLKLAESATPRVRAALQAYLNAIQKIGKGTGKRAARYRQDAREAAAEANRAVPCWIMPHHRVSESLPPQFGCFDLVVIDEASQSDLSALPALLRGRKLLIVGDDKQVSPEGVGQEEQKIKATMQRYLGEQVALYRAQMSPERSIYDLAKVVFAGSGVMLKEHFRCVAPIIEYSKREFYAHELRPLRLPRPSERIDPPLVDVWIQNAERKDDVNAAEADYIVGEIRRIAADPRMQHRSIGVVSLLGESQALHIWERLVENLSPELLHRHAIACGDARTFQGRERDIMFLSMVSAPNAVGAPLSRDIFAQRFNVAASRARDRMVLVRSVDLDDLSEADRLRRGLIAHFSAPFAEHADTSGDPRDRCESPMERELYDWLAQRGYRVTPQARIGAYRIDLLVEGGNDARLAVECDGDRYEGPARWADDIRRQRALERTGWAFWRCFAASLVLRREAVLGDLVATLDALGIRPVTTGAILPGIHVEARRVRVKTEDPAETTGSMLNAG